MSQEQPHVPGQPHVQDSHTSQDSHTIQAGMRVSSRSSSLETGVFAAGSRIESFIPWARK